MQGCIVVKTLPLGSQYRLWKNCRTDFLNLAWGQNYSKNKVRSGITCWFFFILEDSFLIFRLLDFCYVYLHVKCTLLNIFKYFLWFGKVAVLLDSPFCSCRRFVTVAILLFRRIVTVADLYPLPSYP